MTPTIGRIVIYKDDSGRECAAIITAVNEDNSIDLTVFPPRQNSYPVRQVSEGNDNLQWHWPPRV